jgi:hypothetical protein
MAQGTAKAIATNTSFVLQPLHASSRPALHGHNMFYSSGISWLKVGNAAQWLPPGLNPYACFACREARNCALA